MSVLIRGEEMPKNCIVCKNYYYCELWSKLTINKRCKERHPDCLLVEVKEPHGRLGDLDALQEQIKLTIQDAHMSALWKQGMIYALGLVEASKTVIEAEEEK